MPLNNFKCDIASIKEEFLIKLNVSFSNLMSLAQNLTRSFQKHIHAVSCSLFAERKIMNFENLLQQRMSDSILLLYFHVNLKQSKGKC